MDQFYTQLSVSKKIIKNLKDLNILTTSSILIEPSAGTGSFLIATKEILKNKFKYIAFDIEPKNEKFKIEKTNFLQVKSKYSNKNIIVGNPPFGKRSKLAIDFINKSFEWSNVVCFILPIQFERFLTQKQILKEAKLVYSERLQPDIFIYNDKNYNVNTVFQIWTVDVKLLGFEKDLRKHGQDQTRHEDFETRIHNNTELTREKYFTKRDFDWDIAIHRQGFYDYNIKITNPKDLIPNRQYLFIKFKTNEAKDIFNKIDFTKLSKTNTQTPGFSTTDLVREYNNLTK